MSLFYSISPSRGTMSYLIVTSPSAPLDDNSLSDFLCFGWPWQFWGILVRHFIECPSIWVYLIFLMMILEKGRPQKWNVILTTSHLDMMSALLMWWLALITWPRWYLWGFFCVACVCANLLQLCPTLCVLLFAIPWTVARQAPLSMGFKRKNTGVGSHALLPGISPTQGLNPGLLHCRQILHHLSNQGSPWILEWVAYPFSRGSSRLTNQTGVSCTADRFFSSWAF